MTATANTPTAILLATDLSARCDRALTRAVQLARQWGARLVVATVLPDTAAASITTALSWPSADADDGLARQLAERRLQRLLEGEADDLQVDVRIGHGPIGRTLLRIAAQEDCGLIVTGIARDSLFELPLLGSTVLWLTRHSMLPVLIVHDRVRGPYRNLAVACDFSDSATAAARCALALFDAPLQLSLVHALDSSSSLLDDGDRDAQQEQARLAAREQAQAVLAQLRAHSGHTQLHKVIEAGEPARVIASHAQQAGAELVIVATHGRGALFDLLIGSVARRIVETLETDTLLVRDPRSQAAAAVNDD